MKINNSTGPYFTSHKGVRQGDPFSPTLFNFVADCLARMVRKAQRNDLICGLADNLVDKCVAVLQYADDTIMCLKDDLNVARNMKLLLYLYELMSGVKINSIAKMTVFQSNILGFQLVHISSMWLIGHL